VTLRRPASAAALAAALAALAAGCAPRLRPPPPGLPAEPTALLALMTLHHARRRARVDADGALVLLRDQDRSLWDRAAIDRGIGLVERALRMRRPPGPCALQAAIAALHAEATRAEETDWRQILALYDALMRTAPTAVVAVNRAVAVAEVQGPEPALEEIDVLAATDALAAFGPRGGPRARPAPHSPTWRRICSTTEGSLMKAMTRMRPPQRLHLSASTPYTRKRSRAHVRRRAFTYALSSSPSGSAGPPALSPFSSLPFLPPATDRRGGSTVVPYPYLVRVGTWTRTSATKSSGSYATVPRPYSAAPLPW